MLTIPPHATRVFQGVIFDVYQWQQEMFDGTVRTFEALKRPDTVVVLPLQGDRIFYAHQEQPAHKPYLSLFGGRAEPDEDPLITAQRELLEETGFTSENWRLLRHITPPGKIAWNVYYFVAADCRKTAEPVLDGGEKIEMRDLPLAEFLEKIVPDPDFYEPELRAEIMDAFNPAKAARLKFDILGCAYPGDLSDDEWRNPDNKGCCA